MDDRELVARCVADDSEAWTRFVRRHAPRLRGVIEELRDQLPKAQRVAIDTEELVVAVFSSLLGDGRRRLCEMGEQADVDAWLALISRRLCLKRAQRSMRLSRVSARLGNAEECAARQAVRRALASWPLQDRLAASLFFLEHSSSDRIATHLGLSRSQVDTLLERALELFESDAGWGQG